MECEHPPDEQGGGDEDGPVVGVGEVEVGEASVVVEGSSFIVTVVLEKRRDDELKNREG